MTDPPLATPAHPRPSRTALVVVAVCAVLAAVVAGIALQSGGARKPQPQRPTLIASLRNQAIVRLLADRSVAIVHHDRAAFLATIDPRSRRFRRRQARMFANLAAVRFAGWSYSMSRTTGTPPPDASRYDDPVWAPSSFALHYRLADFDAQPTNLRQYPTFVERDGHWYLASLSDFARSGQVSATELWDYGPVSVVERPGVLVLGSPAQRATMLAVARDVQTAIPQVTSVWGTDWPRSAVVLVPQTTQEMGRIDDDHEDLSQIAALTSAEVQVSRGHPAPVGDRITINPQNWPQLSRLGAQVVIRHELTHVAAEAATGTQTPIWLIEGFADYVGFKFDGVPVSAGAAELQAQIRAGDVPSRLPTDRAFRSDPQQLAVNYEAAWFACRTIAMQYGEPTLVSFYRAVGTSTKSTARAVRGALRDVLHLRLPQFIALWQADMQAELA